MKFLLDTNTISLALRGIGNVGDRLRETTPSEVCVSTITEAELWFGVRKRKSKKLENCVRQILAPIEKIEFSSEAAMIFGKIHADLEAKGMTIGACDSMIAAIAIEHNLTLVTDNIKHFSRVKKLKTVNWKSD